MTSVLARGGPVPIRSSHRTPAEETTLSCPTHISIVPDTPRKRVRHTPQSCPRHLSFVSKTPRNRVRHTSQSCPTHPSIVSDTPSPPCVCALGLWATRREREKFNGHSYLTQCSYWLVSKNQLPHKIVNFIFQLVRVNNQLTIFWGGRLSRDN